MRNILFVLLFWSTLPLFSSNYSGSLDVKFKQISLKEGLSQSTVFNILQDSIGYLWIATDDGLNRYDGYKFTLFKNDKNDPQSLMDNTVLSLFLHKNHFLWLGTNRGLSCYDTYLNKFYNYPKTVGGEKMWVYKIAELIHDEFLLATNLGLYKFSQSKGYSKLPFPNNLQASALMKLSSGEWLVGSFSGLYVYSPKFNTSKLIGLKGINVQVLLSRVNRPQSIWLGTEGHGVMSFDLRKKL